MKSIDEPVSVALCFPVADLAAHFAIQLGWLRESFLEGLGKQGQHGVEALCTQSPVSDISHICY